MLFSFMDAANDRTACRRTRLPLLLIFGSARPAMQHDGSRGDYPAGRDAPLLSPLYDSARVSVRRYEYLEGSRCRGAHLTLKGHAVVPTAFLPHFYCRRSPLVLSGGLPKDLLADGHDGRLYLLR